MELKKLKVVSILMVLLHSVTFNAQECKDNWLSIDGNKLIDAAGNQVTLAGVNWFGFETALSSYHGLWTRDHKSGLQQIKDLGFNCIRIPWHNKMLDDDASISIGSFGTDPYTGISPMNEIESTFSKPIELLDETIKWCQENDMKVILDCHSRNPDAYLVEASWYTETTSHQKWIEDWMFIADRYKDYSAVIGMDINNEPHGKIGDPDGAFWGTGNIDNDWRLASEECGNAILAVNPNVLIMVEGIEQYVKPDGTETSYWWGGNLQGARDYPVRLSDPSKLMYSPHEYGPTVFAQEWFSSPDFPGNLVGIWEEYFNFLNTEGTSPLLIGELGIREPDGDDEIWFSEFVKFIKDQGLHFTFWCMNPNSGDTGGIWKDDWVSINQWKMDYIEDILSDPIPNCVVVDGTLSNEAFDTKVVDFKIFPNPSTEHVTFSTTSNNLENVVFYDLFGSRLNVASNNKSKTSLEFNLSGLQTGVYLAKVTSSEGIEGIFKVIKK